jgi:hypothetical protein
VLQRCLHLQDTSDPALQQLPLPAISMPESSPPLNLVDGQLLLMFNNDDGDERIAGGSASAQIGFVEGQRVVLPLSDTTIDAFTLHDYSHSCDAWKPPAENPPWSSVEVGRQLLDVLQQQIGVLRGYRQRRTRLNVGMQELRREAHSKMARSIMRDTAAMAQLVAPFDKHLGKEQRAADILDKVTEAHEDALVSAVTRTQKADVEVKQLEKLLAKLAKDIKLANKELTLAKSTKKKVDENASRTREAIAQKEEAATKVKQQQLLVDELMISVQEANEALEPAKSTKTDAKDELDSALTSLESAIWTFPDVIALEAAADTALLETGLAALQAYAVGQQLTVRLDGKWFDADVAEDGVLVVASDPVARKADVFLHPWNHAPRQLPLADFNEMHTWWAALLRAQHTHVADPLSGSRLDVLQHCVCIPVVFEDTEADLQGAADVAGWLGSLHALRATCSRLCRRRGRRCW